MHVRKNLHLFKKVGDRHNFNTRNRNKLDQPSFRLSKVHTSFMGYCVKCYIIPLRIIKYRAHILELNERKFKTCIKRTLCSQAYYKLEDYINDSIKEEFWPKNAWLNAGPAPQPLGLTI